MKPFWRSLGFELLLGAITVLCFPILLAEMLGALGNYRRKERRP